MNHETIRKLIEMKMTGMAEAYKQQAAGHSSKLDFDDRFSLMVDTEYDRRRNNKLQRLIHQATFDIPTAAIEDIHYYEDRKLSREKIEKLAAGLYLVNHNNIIVMGATGAGKSYLACSFGNAACRQFYRVKYIRFPELLDEFKIAKSMPDDSYKKLMRTYTRFELLILDEWLLHDLTDEELFLTMEIIEKREKARSTIFCTQFAPEGWYDKLGSGATGEAVIDRIIHDSYKIMIDGDISMRERLGVSDEF